MAGDWLKVEHVTPHKPEVKKLARLMGVTPDDAFGKVIRFWMWLDSNCVDGVVDGVVSQDIDDLVTHTGFANALKKVGWLEFNDPVETIEIPNFNRHNGESSKKRALKNKRQSKWRSSVDANVDTTVDKETSTTASTREEKRREDKDIPEAKLPSPIDGKLKTLKTYLDQCNEAGIKAIPEDHAVFSYAKEMKLEHEMVAAAWYQFKHKYINQKKKYKDWRLTFLNCVKENWLKLWWFDPSGSVAWTSKGNQAKLAMNNDVESKL